MGSAHLPGSATGRRWLVAVSLLGMASVADADDFVYVVRPGDNPWNLTERYLRGVAYWPKLQALNRIADPLHIKPGTVLRIPTEWLRLIAAEVRVAAWSGDVSWSTADGAPVKPVAGALLAAGARVRTGSDASLTLEFDDGARVLMLADGELLITQAARMPKGGPIVQLQLVRGNLENLVAPRGDRPGRFEIGTPAAVAAVRGTAFRVGASADDARSEVLAGSVDLGNAAGRQRLREGFGTHARVDRPPAEPVPLLPAPDLADAPRVVERLPFEAPIAPLPGATTYRTLLAPDEAFTSVSSNRTTVAPRLAIGDVPDGDYVVRARGIDPNGLEGYAADRPITIHARPEPPVLIEPPSDARVASDRPTLRWAASAEASTYRLQVSDASSFATLLVDLPSIAGTTLESPRSFMPGPYFWRLASVEATTRPGPFSDPQTFRVVLPGPGVEPPQADSDPLALRWRAMGADVRYRLQVGRQPSFDAPLVDTVVDEARYPWVRPAPGTYHLRVASISPDGQTGPWGSTQTLTIADPPRFWWPVLLLLLPLVLL